MNTVCFSEPQQPENTMNSLVSAVKSEVVTTLRKNYRTFRAVEYRYRIVVGIKYMIKVDVVNQNFIHLKIHVDCHRRHLLIEAVPDKHSEDPMVWKSPKTDQAETSFSPLL